MAWKVDLGVCGGGCAAFGDRRRRAAEARGCRTIRASDLKPGLRDAGVAARGMELVSTRPRPEGFFDPKNPGRPGDAR